MAKSIKEIASYLKAQIFGDPTYLVEGMASFEKATEKELTFITHPSLLEKTRARAVITAEKIETSTSRIFLVVENPRFGFAKALELFERPKEIKVGIDSRAWIEENTEIDSSATIYPFVTIRQGTKIGAKVTLYPGAYIDHDVFIEEDCILYPNVTIFPKTKIGKRVIIHAGCVIGDDGFGYVWDGTKHYKIPQIGKVIIENDVEIGANTAIDRATTGETRIKTGTKIDNLVQIGHNVEVGRHCILCGQVGLAGSSNIGDGSMLGGQSGVGDHIHLGPMNKIAGQSGVVMGNTSANETLMGFPAMPAYDYLRAVSLWKRLPEMHKTLKKLEKEIEELKKKAK